MRSPLAVVNSSPLNLIEPAAIFPGDAMSRITESAVIDFPEPDSPTRTEQLALVDIKANAIDRLYESGAGWKLGLEVFDLEKVRHHSPVASDDDHITHGELTVERNPRSRSETRKRHT
jgi:hypothetical protein